MTRTGRRLRIGMAFAVLAIATAIVARQWSTAEPRAAFDARQALAAGRYDEANSVLARWLHSQTASSEAHLLKGRVAVAMGRIEEAADELKRAQALGRRSGRAGLAASHDRFEDRPARRSRARSETGLRPSSHS